MKHNTSCMRNALIRHVILDPEEEYKSKFHAVSHQMVLTEGSMTIDGDIRVAPAVILVEAGRSYTIKALFEGATTFSIHGIRHEGEIVPDSCDIETWYFYKHPVFDSLYYKHQEE